MAADFRQGNLVYSSIPTPKGTAEVVELTLHPQRGIAAHTLDGQRVRWQKAEEGKFIFSIEKPHQMSENAAKLLAKGKESTELAQQEESSREGKGK